MKRISLLFLLVIIFFFAIPSYSYKPGPIYIRKCPDCWKLVKERTTLSGNTFGARMWTDGRVEAPMLPDRPWLVKCPHCSALFWKDEAEIVETMEPFDKSKRWHDVSGYSTPSYADYYEMLDHGPYDRKKEKYLRIRAWWATNDRWRYFKDESEKKVFSPSETKNLEILYELLGEKEVNERIMKAEVARELGWFEECVFLLTNSFDESLSKAVLMIRTLAEKKNSGVQEITRREPRKGAKW